MEQELMKQYIEQWPLYVAEVDGTNAAFEKKYQSNVRRIEARHASDQVEYDAFPFYKKWNRQDPKHTIWFAGISHPPLQVATVADFLVWVARRENEK